MSETTNRKPGDPKSGDHGKHRDAGKHGDNANPDNRPGKLEKRLDDALEETFPSSDPVSVKITK